MRLHQSEGFIRAPTRANALERNARGCESPREEHPRERAPTGGTPAGAKADGSERPRMERRREELASGCEPPCLKAAASRTGGRQTPGERGRRCVPSAAAPRSPRHGRAPTSRSRRPRVVYPRVGASAHRYIKELPAFGPARSIMHVAPSPPAPPPPTGRVRR